MGVVYCRACNMRFADSLWLEGGGARAGLREVVMLRGAWGGGAQMRVEVRTSCCAAGGWCVLVARRAVSWRLVLTSRYIFSLFFEGGAAYEGVRASGR